MLPLFGICLGGFTARADGQFPVPQIDWSPREYICYRTQEAPAIDGRLTESCWVAARWTEDFIDIEGPSRPTPRFRTRVRMLWDDTHFYVGAQMEEPHVWGTLTDRDAVIFHDNDFEVFIDADGDTHTYYELEINALGTEWDLLLVKPYRDGGPPFTRGTSPGCGPPSSSRARSTTAGIATAAGRSRSPFRGRRCANARAGPRRRCRAISGA